MSQRYSCGYLLLFFTTVVADDHAGITVYETVQKQLQHYVTVMKDRQVDRTHLAASYDQAITNVHNVSEFVTTCISTSSVLKNGSAMVKCNAALQLAMVSYAVLQGFIDLWQMKKQFYQEHLQMQYYDAIMKYPFLGIMQYQIIMMDQLIKMCVSGTFPERVFAKIHLAGMMLPEPYQHKTKKWSKKLYKQAFDEQSILMDAASFQQDHPYKKFSKKIIQDWRLLLFKVHKMPTEMMPFYVTPWHSAVNNPQNQMLLELINAGRFNDAVRLQNLCEHNHNLIAQNLCAFYNV